MPNRDKRHLSPAAVFPPAPPRSCQTASPAWKEPRTKKKTPLHPPPNRSPSLPESRRNLQKK
ncbi:predicted protein [Plenodomus lingam JN3]|uniref:Predicted protein n=1 Tax=Leptosphaeria maculans (strain JN3 / isolate v23.1.3 / race Av1-4-5-6-7-8) TaxID=985895 RepID=E5A4T9_LEPMJ|nr:predicted protein [Plenodomus lingam JN3]CBX98637.1 predicted protein [Plenodomus lingam JN3]